MSLKLRCPSCKNVFDIGSSPSGAIVQCSGCRVSVRVPSTAQQSPPPTIKVVSAAASPSPPSKPNTPAPTTPSLTPGAWNALGWGALMLLFFISKRMGWISPSATKADFVPPLVIFLVVVGGLGFAGWRLVGVIRKAAAPPPDSRPPLPPPPPFPPAAPPIPPAVEQWWLQVAGQATGPFTTAVIIEAVRNGDFPGTTLACPVGGTQWLPIASRPTFAVGSDSSNAR